MVYKILDRVNMNNSKVTIVQSYDLNNKLGDIVINKLKSKIWWIDTITIYPWIELAKNQESGEFIREGNHRIKKEYTRPVLGIHLLWNDIHPGFCWWGVLWIPRIREKVTRVINRGVLIVFLIRLGCLLPLHKIQQPFLPYNIPQNLHIWQPGEI